MLYLLCRNRVTDYAKWREIFDSHAEAHRAAGLHLKQIWQTIDDPNNIFFLFEVDSIEKARAFVSAPEAAKAGKFSGVIDGEMHFLSLVDKY